MRAVCGLGNPGREYENTRHNIGFTFIDLVATGLGARWRQWDECEVAELPTASLLKEPLIKAGPSGVSAAERSLNMRSHPNSSGTARLVKPQSFMNRSGEALRPLMEFYQIPVTSLLVVHDDLDLPLGSLRLKQGGGDGGHNGLRSITSTLGPEYFRLRVGVGRPINVPARGHDDAPPATANRPGQVVDWVLGKFSAVERDAVRELLLRAEQALFVLCTNGLAEAQRLFH